MADEGPRKAGPLQVVKMVLSAFLGIRARKEHERYEVTPAQFIIAAVIAAAVFVLSVITVVRIVTSK